MRPVATDVLNSPLARGHFKRWRVHAPDPAAGDLARELRVPPLVAQLLCRRGVHDADSARRFLQPKLTDLHDPALLPGCERAALRLVEAVRAREPIVIYGDYDVDGITATAILYHTLRTADPGADVRTYVPHRLEEGYGLNEEAIGSLCDSGARVIVSVDCGITAVGSAAVAKARGVDLIVTDHHLLGAQLPDAHTLVHPSLGDTGGLSASVSQSGEGTGGQGASGTRPYPFPELCGAGVAYKLAWQFSRVWCGGGEQVSESLRNTLVNLLPLAALGTIADVVPLVGENRVLASFGLARVHQTPWVGLNALIDASRLREGKIDSEQVGFILAPRLNACGRMGHAREAVELLTNADPASAKRIATFLNGENDRRRATEQEILRQAKEQIVEHGYDEPGRRVLVLSDARWHAGVVGIVCSRLVESYGRPAVLLSTANGEAQGSARSIDGYDIHAAFAECAEHLSSFGGHAMAAGLRLKIECIDAFRNALTLHARRHITEEQMVPVLELDAEATIAELTGDTVSRIVRLGPFGRGNAEAVVRVCGVELKQPATTLGREAKHLTFSAFQGGAAVRCIGWNMGSLQPKLPAGKKLDLAATPKLNHYQGRTTVELTVRDLILGGA